MTRPAIDGAGGGPVVEDARIDSIDVLRGELTRVTRHGMMPSTSVSMR